MAGGSITSSLLVNLLAATTLIYAADAGQCFPAFFIFGDSYLDVGNKAALYPEAFQQPGALKIVSNKLPYGQTFFKRPTGRFSDGRMISDFLAQGLGAKEFPGAYLQSVGSSFKSGANFALGGGTALSNSYYISHNISTSVPYSLADELGWFLRFKDLAKHASEAPLESAFLKGLYIIGEIGSNDYTVGTFNGGMSPSQLQTTVLPLVMKEIHELFQALYAGGARNFLFIGLPPMVDGPGYRSFGNFIHREGLYELTSAHNDKLRQMISKLKETHTDAFIVFADFEGVHKEIMDNPKRHGFTDTTSACCGAPGPFNFNATIACGQPGYTICKHPSKFAYWDFSHFTEHYNQVVAEAFLTGRHLQPPDALKQKCKC